MCSDFFVPKPVPSTEATAVSPSPSHTDPPDLFVDLGVWRGSLSLFQGFTGTRPVQELVDVSRDQLTQSICPEKPTQIEDKRQGMYFVPCLLKEAPLTGKTLEVAEKNGHPTVGKMRSKTHMTQATLLVMDIDGLSRREFRTGIKGLKRKKISFLWFTTHSYGHPEKPGIRVRLIIFLNRPVDLDEYSAVWNGVNQTFFAGKADASGANMYQQQGVWCCYPDRAAKARARRFDAGLADVDALMAIGKKQETTTDVTIPTFQPAGNPPRSFHKPSTYPESDAHRIADRCAQIGTFRDTQGAEQSEPLWYDCLGIVAHCTDGKTLCHDWSSGYSGYSWQETERKIVQRLKAPPTTCTQFRKTHPKGCEGCRATYHSPITLGMEKPKPAPPENPLAAMQQLYALLNLNGKLSLFNKSQIDNTSAQKGVNNLELSTLSDGKLLIHRALKAQYPSADADAIVKIFVVDPGTSCYQGIEFNPKDTTDGYLNLWIGPTITPRKGSWKKIRWFFLNIICNGDKKAWKYLLRYLAHALQRPWEKPGVMIILIGGQGTGKGTVFSILSRIWGATFLQSNRIEQITGNFNGVLERAYIVCLDEALFVGDRKASDSLKSLVTEPVLQINEKYQPSRQIGSFHRFFAATNADHFKNTERDDRRDFTLRVSDAKKGDMPYWTALHHEIENGGVEAMVHDLLRLDLSTFNVRVKPVTEELLEQKLLSLGGFEVWWYQCLQEGKIGYGDWPDFIATSGIIEGVIETADRRLYRKPTAHTIAKDIQRLCPSAVKIQKQEGLARARGYVLPSLKQARIEFEAYIGGPVVWEEVLERQQVHEALDDAPIENPPSCAEN